MKYPLNVNGYRLGKTVGQGSMGKVKIATCPDKPPLACKIIKAPTFIMNGVFKSLLEPIDGTTVPVQEHNRIIREINLCMIMRHPSIPRCRYGVDNSGLYSFRTATTTYSTT